VVPIWMICMDKDGSLWLMRVRSRRSGIETLRYVYGVEPVRCRQLDYDSRSEYFVLLKDLCKDGKVGGGVGRETH